MHAEMKPFPGALSLTFVSVNYDVEEIDEVAGIVEGPPEGRYGVVELPKYGTSYHEHEVVQDGYRNQHKPLQMIQGIVTGLQEVVTGSFNPTNHFLYHDSDNQLKQGSNHFLLLVPYETPN
jgi:hypothetical protein